MCTDCLSFAKFAGCYIEIESNIKNECKSCALLEHKKSSIIQTDFQQKMPLDFSKVPTSVENFAHRAQWKLRA